ncbi:MAG: nicotinamide riboside transporter PnuC [Steroidobacteraceae bacterium]|nr:nicotinamide riboside transporter PnuC [Steroidobacteraceae bacterium]MDW8259218.1 nicotinamide riboside transporter PnuC [Gammaproteobacteria bacterium]
MSQSLLAQWAATQPLEWLALLAGVGYALLAVRHIRWCWLAGGVSSATLVWLSAEARLPMQSALQSCYVLLAVYGFWRWSRAAALTKAPPIVTLPVGFHVVLLIGIAIAGGLLGPIVERFAAAAWPRLDTALMIASLLATWMATASKLENWLYWIAIDLLSCFLYVQQGLWLVGLLYLVYAAIAVLGFRHWRRLRRARLCDA